MPPKNLLLSPLEPPTLGISLEDNIAFFSALVDACVLFEVQFLIQHDPQVYDLFLRHYSSSIHLEYHLIINTSVSCVATSKLFDFIHLLIDHNDSFTLCVSSSISPAVVTNAKSFAKAIVVVPSVSSSRRASSYKIFYNRGPKVEPCGMPAVTSISTFLAVLIFLPWK